MTIISNSGCVWECVRTCELCKIESAMRLWAVKETEVSKHMDMGEMKKIQDEVMFCVIYHKRV